MLVYLNGAFIDRTEARISIDDRGFLFGDAAYEAFRVRHGRFLDVERHWRRLRQGLEVLRIDHPDAAPARLADIVRRLLDENTLRGEAFIYIEVSRGTAPRRHAFPPAETRPTIFVSATPFTPRRTERESGVAAVTYPDIRWGRCDLKTVNLLPNVLANQHAVERDAFEAIFVRDGVITEATLSSVFAVVDGVVRTHPTGARILAGITREIVLELARAHGIAVREDALRIDELGVASEVFLTGTSTDVMPVVRVDGRPVAGGSPGPVALRLFDLLEEHRSADVDAPALP